jgi:beta-glucosidase
MSVDAIEQRVEQLLRQLTLREKIALLSGRDSWSTMPIERPLDGAPDGIPALVMTDGPHGVRSNQPDAGRPAAGPTTAFPTGVAMASTWNAELVEQAARALGEETKAMGCDILLGPCVNIVRTPLAGRNFESYGEDPYLTGRIGAAYVKGVQSAGAGTSLKHYAANNQETERYRGSSEVDERTLRELYLPHFETVVKEAEPWTVMCAYNRINGVYASQHHTLLTEILKEEWAFPGVVVSDWTANHTITESVQGGLDLEMPGPAKYYGALLEDAVKVWQIEESTIDEAARRVLRMVIRSGKLDGTDPKGSVNTPEHQALARQVAEEAMVLLKNQGGILPIRPEGARTVAIIGPAAEEFSVSGGGSAYTVPPYQRGPLAALREALGDQVELRWEPGIDNWRDIPAMKAAYVRPARGGEDGAQGFFAEYFANHDLSGAPALARVDPRVDFFWFMAPPTGGSGPFSARWTAALRVPVSGRYTIDLRIAGTGRAYLDGAELLNAASSQIEFDQTAEINTTVDLEAGRTYELRLELQSASHGVTHIRLGFTAGGPQPAAPGDPRLERAAALAREADLALVFVGTNEQFETEGHDRPDLHLPGLQDALVQRVAEANPNTVVVLNTGAPVAMPWLDEVAAVVQAHFPGLEGGAALSRLLTGEANFSGKLVSTYPRRLEETASFTNLSLPGARQVRYGEGLYVGYRYNDKTGIPALFPFGHGLSYTTFAYSDLRVTATARAGQPVDVSLKVTNAGPVAGKETVQVYVRDVESSVDRPEKALKGFQKVALQPGETKEVTFTLDERALAYYDVVRKEWVVEPGAFEVLAGASAADIRLRAGFTIEG